MDYFVGIPVFKAFYLFDIFQIFQSQNILLFQPEKFHLRSFFAAFHLCYFSTFSVGILLEKQTAAEILQEFLFVTPGTSAYNKSKSNIHL